MESLNISSELDVLKPIEKPEVSDVFCFSVKTTSSCLDCELGWEIAIAETAIASSADAISEIFRLPLFSFHSTSKEDIEI